MKASGFATVAGADAADDIVLWVLTVGQGKETKLGALLGVLILKKKRVGKVALKAGKGKAGFDRTPRVVGIPPPRTVRGPCAYMPTWAGKYNMVHFLTYLGA